MWITTLLDLKWSCTQRGQEKLHPDKKLGADMYYIKDRQMSSQIFKWNNHRKITSVRRTALGWPMLVFSLSTSDFIFMFFDASVKYKMSLWIGLMSCCLRCKLHMTKVLKENAHKLLLCNQMFAVKSVWGKWGNDLISHCACIKKYLHRRQHLFTIVEWPQLYCLCCRKKH